MMPVMTMTVIASSKLKPRTAFFDIVNRSGSANAGTGIL
jgi:hypothetical protein